MDELPITIDAPSPAALSELRARADEVRRLLTGEDCEVRRPLFVEFAGTPKAGKSSIIGIVCHFLRRVGFNVVQPAEGASLGTPPTLRDDWFAFNSWSAGYALRHILELSHESRPADIVVLDRGLFDATAWLGFLEQQGRLGVNDRAAIEQYLTLDLWRSRELCVFLFRADDETSLKREIENKLIQEAGSVMNADTIAALNTAYTNAYERVGKLFRVFAIDTSYIGGRPPSFQSIASVVASKVLDLMHELLDQKLLVTSPAGFDGFEESGPAVSAVITGILNDGSPRFMDRSKAELDSACVQVVPYAYLRNAEGRYFVARRRGDHPRSELRGKYTLMVGGHAEQKDWTPSDPAAVFEGCLRRELDEELMGLDLKQVSMIGIISDSRSTLGSHHLAVVFEVVVGGAPRVRRQASDQEFGREAVLWKTANEIRTMVSNLDPWSQLVAQKRFGAELPVLPDEPTLFTRSRSQG